MPAHIASKHVRDKAYRILDEDRLKLTRLDPDQGIAFGLVDTSNGPYEVRYNWVSKTFRCTCEWGKHSSSFSQRLCSHAEALRISSGF